MFMLLFVLLFISNICFAKEEVKFHQPQTQAEKTLDVYFKIYRRIGYIKNDVKKLLPEFYELYMDKNVDYYSRGNQIVDAIKTQKLKEVRKEQSAKAEEEKKRFLDENKIEYDPLNTVDLCISNYPEEGGYRTIYETDNVVYIEWKDTRYTYVYKIIKTNSSFRIDGILCPKSDYYYYYNYNLNYNPPHFSNLASQDFGK